MILIDIDVFTCVMDSVLSRHALLLLSFCLYSAFFLLPPSANFTSRGSLAPGIGFPLNIYENLTLSCS